MADRGRPIPISARLEIKERRQSREAIRKIADSLGLSKTTVHKYSPKNGTNLLHNSTSSS